MKKWAAISLLLILLFSSTALGLENRVFDEANLLSQAEETALQKQIETLVDAYHYDIVIVTTDSNPTTPRRFADDYYETGGFGTDENHSGALFLIDMDNRELYISTEGGMIDVLNDARIERLLDILYEDAAKGQYFSALTAALDRLGGYQPDTSSALPGVMSGYLQSGPVRNQYRYMETDPFSSNWLLLSLGVGLAVAAITCAIILAQYKRNFKPVSYDYRSNTRLNLSVSNDTLIDSRVTKQYIPPASSSGGSSGGSSGRSTTHHSSSGRTHGGGGRKF